MYVILYIVELQTSMPEVSIFFFSVFLPVLTMTVYAVMDNCAVVGINTV